MSRRARPLSARGRALVLLGGAAALAAEAAVLIGYVSRFGLDRFAVVPAVLAVLAAVLLGLGATRTPERARPLRLATGVLCLLSFGVLAVAGLAASSLHDSDTAGGLLFAAGLFLLVAAPWVLAAGRPRG